MVLKNKERIVAVRRPRHGSITLHTVQSSIEQRVAYPQCRPEEGKMCRLAFLILVFIFLCSGDAAAQNNVDVKQDTVDVKLRFNLNRPGNFAGSILDIIESPNTMAGVIEAGCLAELQQ